VRGTILIRLRYSHPLELPLLLSQTKHNWSLVPVKAMWTVLDTIWLPNVAWCLQPAQIGLQQDTYEVAVTDIHKITDAQVNLRLLLSHTKYHWSPAPVEKDVDSARYNIVDQCGAGDQPKLDLLRTHTRLL
jgi:hypothetical protein